MQISYDLDKVTKPKFIEPFISGGFIEYVNGGVIEDVPLDTMVTDYRKNVGRTLATIGSAESNQFISDMQTEFTDPDIGFRDGMPAMVYVKKLEGLEVKNANVGGYHKNVAAKNIGAESLPGIIIKFVDNISDIKKREIEQRLQNAENRDQIKVLPVSKDDTESSLKDYVQLWRQDKTDEIRNGLTLEKYLQKVLKVDMGYTSENTRRGFIDRVLGSKSPYRNVAIPLKDNKVLNQFLKDEYNNDIEYNPFMGNIQFPAEYKFGSAKNTTPVKLFSDSQDKWKPIAIKWDSFSREWAKLTGHVTTSYKDGSRWKAGIFLVIDKHMKSLDELNQRRDEVLDYLKDQVNIFNVGLSKTIVKKDIKAIQIIGMMAQGKGESKGIITLEEYEKSKVD